MALILGVGGLALLVISLPAPEGWLAVANLPTGLAPAGASLLIGALASIVALYAAVSWEDQRAAAASDERDRRAQDRLFETWKIRAGYYDKIAVSIVEKLESDSHAETAPGDKGRAAFWGSPAVLRALENWDEAVISINANQVESLRAEGDHDDSEKRKLWTAFAALMQALRIEIPNETRDKLEDKTMLRAVFKDYRDLDNHGKISS